MVLYLLHHPRRIRIILLHSIIWTQRKQRRLRTIASNAANSVDCWYRLTSNMLRPNIPRPRFPVSLSATSLPVAFRTISQKPDSVKKLTYPSEYCNTLPFFDHAHQCSPGSTLSLLFRMRRVFGASLFGGFETLQTRKSPSTVCVASMSDLCFVDEACHTKFATAEGARAVVRVCRMVKEGWSPTIKIDPFWYL